MNRIIKIPCLPENNVKHCLIGERYTEEISELKELGIECITLKKNNLLDDEISCHADILAFNFGNGQVLLNRGIIGESELNKIGLEPIVSRAESSSPYPDDIPLNVAFTGKYIVCNSIYTAREIIGFAKQNNVEIINTRQGYSKCNLCIVSKDSVITEDKGLASLLKNYQFNVLLISSGDIYLSDAHYGFLGGASCKISQNKMYFSGNLERHRDYKAIVNFLKLYNVEPIYNKSRKLTDFGGIVQLTEEIK